MYGGELVPEGWDCYCLLINITELSFSYGESVRVWMMDGLDWGKGDLFVAIWMG